METDEGTRAIVLVPGGAVEMKNAIKERLEADWLKLVGLWGCPTEAGRRTFADLAARYAEPARHYHNLDHVRAVLEAIIFLDRRADDQPALRFAAWFHDAVYDPRAGDNEEKSASLAENVLDSLEVPKAVRSETARLILLTKTHLAGADDLAGQVLVDADLAILGAAEEAYDCYAGAIRREYAWVSEEQYRTGRCQVLERFLQRPRIYATKEAFERWEEQARRNLRRERASRGQ
jgi:predicted metal-dependent HD superfamily phosphohydrolase